MKEEKQGKKSSQLYQDEMKRKSQVGHYEKLRLDLPNETTNDGTVTDYQPNEQVDHQASGVTGINVPYLSNISSQNVTITLAE